MIQFHSDWSELAAYMDIYWVSSPPKLECQNYKTSKSYKWIQSEIIWIAEDTNRWRNQKERKWWPKKWQQICANMPSYKNGMNGLHTANQYLNEQDNSPISSIIDMSRKKIRWIRKNIPPNANNNRFKLK